jgi:hypothetical protein
MNEHHPDPHISGSASPKLAARLNFNQTSKPWQIQKPITRFADQLKEPCSKQRTQLLDDAKHTVQPYCQPIQALSMRSEYANARKANTFKP